MRGVATVASSSLAFGHSILTLGSLATEEECQRLRAAAAAVASRVRDVAADSADHAETAAWDPAKKLVRMRADKMLDEDGVALCEALL
jgi:hypothetical protein